MASSHHVYAQKKYSAQDRIETAQSWMREYPERVPVVIYSTHWPFYSFKCLLAELELTVEELVSTILKQWSHKFPPKTTNLILHLYKHKSILQNDQTMEDLHHQLTAHSDGILYIHAQACM